MPTGSRPTGLRPTGLRPAQCEVETSTVLRTRDGQDAFAVVVSVTNTSRLDLLQGPSAPVEVTADRAIIPLLRQGTGARVVRFREPRAAVEALCANQLADGSGSDGDELCRSLLSDVRVPVLAGGPEVWRTLGQLLATKGANAAVVVNPTADGSPLHLLVMTEGATVVVRIVDPAGQAVGQGVDRVVSGWFTGVQADMVDRAQVAASRNGRRRTEPVTATVEPAAPKRPAARKRPATKKRAAARKVAARKVAARKVAARKAAAPARKTTPARKATTNRKAAPTRKAAAPTRKATAPARKAAPTRKATAPARKAAPTRKTTPARKAAAPARKATTNRRAAPTRKAAAPSRTTTPARTMTAARPSRPPTRPTAATRPAARRATTRRTRRTASARGSRRAPAAATPQPDVTPKFSVSLNLRPH